MPSLSANFNVGNAAPTSLVKSAATLQRELATFQDDEAKITYENSAKTADDLATYTAYLNSRITTLQASNTLTDQTKALTMGQDLVTATHANISADITRENINLMSQGMGGTVAGYQQKMQVVGQEYTRALGVGDQALAQSLMSQYYSLSQSAQNAAATSSAAAATLGKSGATSEEGVATNIQKAIDSLNANIQAGGMSKLNGIVSKWVTQNSSMLSTLGVNLPKGAQPSYQDIIYGATEAIYNAHNLAATAMAPYDPATAQSYQDAANAIANGTTKVGTLAGSLSSQQILNWTQNPSMFAPKEEVVDGQLQFTYVNPSDQSGTSAISGLKEQGGKVVANYTGSDFAQSLNAQQVSAVNNDLQKMGLSFAKVTSTTSMTNGIAVQLNDQTKNFLKKLTGGQTGVGVRLYLQANGNYQVGLIDANGNQHIYTITKDQSGNFGAFDTTNGKPLAVGGQYGFNENVNGLVNAKSNSKTTIGQNIGVQYFGTSKYDTKTMFGDTSKLNNLITQAQAQQTYTIKQAQIALQNSIPTSLKAPPLAPPPVQPQQPAPIQLQKTAFPQSNVAGAATLQPAANPQNNVAGANLNQSGTKGIPISTPAVHGIPL